MCGRFSIVDGTKKVAMRFGGKYTEAQYETFYSAHYNAAPSMMLPIVTTPYPSGHNKEIILARWGLEVFGSNDSDVGRLPMPNARLETAKKLPTFRNAFHSRHCLIPANSYFEWMRTAKFKQPYRILLKDESLFAMAGIWENPITPDSPPTFAVLTQKANPMLSRIHDRMPVILQRKDEDKWLREVGNGVVSLVDYEYPESDLQYYAVTQKMNKVSFESPDAIKPILEPSLGI